MAFLYPVKTLQSDRVRLVVLDPDVHLPLYWKAVELAPQINHYMPFAQLTSLEAVREWYTRWIASDPTRTVWASYDISNGVETFAGIVGLLNTNVENEVTEIGFVTVVPAFQRTHVNTHQNALLLQYCFDELKLRRVQWQAHADNKPSINAAKRLGFKLEGIIRWQRILPEDREGHMRPGDSRPGRHSALLAICWDDWESPGFKEALRAKMARTA
ncbi:acyl-CoA N-acyltransferase [Auricularia subglabra TFB-10046 SS5]|nr:acyl-CoA N-acyltransferase [Auricularia subglabra TFB-10046 SS5]